MNHGALLPRNLHGACMIMNLPINKKHSSVSNYIIFGVILGSVVPADYDFNQQKCSMTTQFI